MVNTKQSYIGHSNESPLLTGPEFNHRALLWSFRGCIKVSEAHTAKIGGQADQNVPTDSNNIFISYQKHQNASKSTIYFNQERDWITAFSTTTVANQCALQGNDQIQILLHSLVRYLCSLKLTEWIQSHTHQAQWRYGKFTDDHISQKIRSLIQHMSARVHHRPARRPSLNTRRFSHLHNTQTPITDFTVH